MPRTILVPLDVDGGAPAAEQIDVAASLAAGQDARLVFLAVEPAVPSYIRAQLPADLMAKTHQSFAASLTGLVAQRALGVPFTCVTRTGRPGQEILACAADEAAELIVIASRDPRGATHLFGSVAAHVVRHAHCSVYVLRHANRA